MATQSIENLRSITLDVIDNYRKTAKYATQALLATSTRSLDKVDAALDQYEGKLSSTVRDTLDFSQEKILAATDKADEALGKLGDSVKTTMATTQENIITVADKTDSAVDKLLDRAAKRVSKFPPKYGMIADLLKGKAAVKSVENLGVPGAKLLRFVSGKLADGTEKVANSISGEKKKAAPARKKAVAKKVAAKKSVLKKVAAKKPVAKKVVAKAKARVRKVAPALAEMVQAA